MSSSGFRVVFGSLTKRKASSTVALSGEPTRLDTRKSFRTGGVGSRHLDCQSIPRLPARSKTLCTNIMHVTGPVHVSAASVE